MYNGIGLTTARGSGTSGYVQKNLSHVKPFAQQKQKDSFLKELQALKDNVLAPPKKANKEILLHQQKRDIQLQLVKMRDKLEKEGLNPDKIEERVKKAEKILNDKLENGELELASAMDYHKKALEKEKEYERVRQAFRMSEDYKPGSAFDFEGQEKKRLEQLYEKEKKKYEQKKQERKAEKEKIKAQESAPEAIEAEGSNKHNKDGRKDEGLRKPEEENVKRTNKEVRERAAARRESPNRRRESTRHRDRSRSPKEHSRKERGGKDRDDIKEKEKEKARRADGSKDKTRLKEKSRSRSRSKDRKTKEAEKRKNREDSKEKTKNKRKSSSSSERSKRSDRSAKKTRRRHDSSSSSGSRRSASSSSSRSSSSSGSD